MGLEPELPLFHGSGSSQKEQLRLHNTGERYQEEVRVQTLDGGGGDGDMSQLITHYTPSVSSIFLASTD